MVDTRVIPLTQGKVALVDADDYDRLSAYKWYAQRYPRSGNFYAYRTGRTPDGSRTAIAMHREILGLSCGDKRVADHIDPSLTLDNRKSNLRIATRAQNCQNARTRIDNRLGLKGVKLHGPTGKFMARIVINGKQKYLGIFASPEIAHEAYRRAATLHRREFARFA